MSPTNLNTPIHNTYIKLHHHSYQSGRCVARTRLCTYIHAACNKCGFKKKKKKEDYVKGVEYRSVNLRNDVLQVFANANKAKHLQSREEMVYQERWASEFSISARTRGLKMNGEGFEVGQREQARDHRLG
jgi:hypothetical protein